MRAPPESFRPTNGAPTFIAVSMIFTIFMAWAPESVPPKMVKSWEKTKMRRPLTRPWPVTTPSVRGRRFSVPKSWHWWTTSASVSTKVPGSMSRSIRSRAVSLPRSCWRSTALGPPPALASCFNSLRRRNFSS